MYKQLELFDLRPYTCKESATKTYPVQPMEEIYQCCEYQQLELDLFPPQC
ncbi:hypothetical protein PL9214430173 [Planktothrix tepida PCC 9214]|uniref:Uncharacterized protein n=1 Tax=Planktothrix tepida PCC 9214 TaxID=671072 RepID=A0A1J1LKR8_9CYAN|nr:hypothetical protein PL9214430173 [Planktothrix tepida PCC 9214]